MTYLKYSKEELDEEYVGEQLYRGRGEIRPIMDSASKAVYDGTRHISDVPYTAHALGTFDLFPCGRSNAPLLLFFHGGYWRRNDKTNWAFLAPPFLERGISVALMNYPLAPAATMDVIVEHARSSIAYIAKKAADLGVDARRIYVSGHSAGGHLTAMATQTRWSDYALDFDPVRGACAISGLYDLLPLKLSKLNEIIKLDLEAAYRNSPIHFISQVDRPTWQKRKLILSVGGAEPFEFHQQQRRFAETWTAYGLACEVVPNEAETHGEILWSIGQGSPLGDAILAMIEADEKSR
jgi:arylformamidase